MRLAEAPQGWWAYTQLSSTALAVVMRRRDGWVCYVAGVPGRDHKQEAHEVLRCGDKAKEGIARAICEHLFYPPIEVDGIDYVY